MPRPPSDATVRALELVRNGAVPYAAAKECGIASNTIYRALARARKAQEAAAASSLARASAEPADAPRRRAARKRGAPPRYTSMAKSD